MKVFAAKRRRIGYRLIGLMLERKGMTMNHKKLYRAIHGRKAVREAATREGCAVLMVNLAA